MQLFGAKIRENIISDHQSRSVGLTGNPAHFFERSSISVDVNSTKLVSVFVEIVLGQVTPRATGFYVKKQLRLMH
jgi:hypothetical protein